MVLEQDVPHEDVSAREVKLYVKGLEDQIQAVEKALNLQIDALSKQMDLRFLANDKAIEIASTALTIRLEHSNGLIAQMKEQSIEFPTVGVTEGLAKRVDLLEGQQQHIEGRTKGGQQLRDIGMLVFGAVIAYLAAKYG